MSEQTPPVVDQATDTTEEKGLLPKLNLTGALFIAIGVACCIVLVAYLMYWNNSNRKYDIARGGEKANQVLSVEDEEADTTSAVTATATKQKIDYLEKELKALNGLGKFSPEDLSDQNIQLMPAEQPSL